MTDEVTVDDLEVSGFDPIAGDLDDETSAKVIAAGGSADYDSDAAYAALVAAGYTTDAVVEKPERPEYL